MVNPLGLLPSAAIVIDSRTRRIKNVSPPAGFYASTGLPPEEVTALLVRNEQLHRGSNLSLRSTNLLWGDGEGWCLYLQRLNRSSHGGGATVAFEPEQPRGRPTAAEPEQALGPTALFEPAAAGASWESDR